MTGMFFGSYIRPVYQCCPFLRFPPWGRPSAHSCGTVRQGLEYTAGSAYARRWGSAPGHHIGHHSSSQRLSATVEQAVEHTAPVDPNCDMRLPLCLLRLEADAMPVTGAQLGNQNCPRAPKHPLSYCFASALSQDGATVEHGPLAMLQLASIWPTHRVGSLCRSRALHPRSATLRSDPRCRRGTPQPAAGHASSDGSCAWSLSR